MFALIVDTSKHPKRRVIYTLESKCLWFHKSTVAKHDILLSLRHDDNQQFGSRVTGGAGWGYPLTENIRLLANFGSAFKAPTFNELYFPGFSNPNLRPEDSRSYEFGTRGKADWGNWSLNVYETHILHLIAFDANTFAPANIDQACIRGFEGVISTHKHWRLQGRIENLFNERYETAAFFNQPGRNFFAMVRYQP